MSLSERSVVGATPLRLVYADPPYPGMAKRRYGDHRDYAGEVDHATLIGRLEVEFDGWALSTSAQALAEVLALCPRPEPGIKGRRYRSGTGVRVLAWCKPSAPPLPNSGMFSWEPVIVRRPPARTVPTNLRDYLVCSPEMYTFRAKPEGYVSGAKPRAFCDWVFRWLSAEPEDELIDLFPGSGAVARAWESFTRQEALNVA